MQKKNYVQEILDIIHSGLPQAELAEKLSDYHAVSYTHLGFDGIGRLGTGKLLLIGLAALDNRDGQILLADIRVAVQLLLGLSLGLGGSLVDGVAFLPPELTAAQEGTGGLFPAHHAAPLLSLIHI